MVNVISYSLEKQIKVRNEKRSHRKLRELGNSTERENVKTK